MNFIKPKTQKSKVNWEISENTLLLIEYYAKYTGYSPDEVVDKFLENLSGDDVFAEWANSQRYSKKLKMLLSYFDIEKGKKGVQINESLEETGPES